MMIETQTFDEKDFQEAMKAQRIKIVYGWQCPKCGRGNSPYAAVCPCGPDVEYTTGNAGYVKLIQTRWGGYIDRGDGAGSG